MGEKSKFLVNFIKNIFNNIHIKIPRYFVRDLPVCEVLCYNEHTGFV